MSPSSISNLPSAVLGVRPQGRVARIGPSSILVRGLADEIGMGARVAAPIRGGGTLAGEVVSIDMEGATILTEGPPTGLRLDDPVRLLPAPSLRPCAGWLGRVVDPDGLPLDGRPLPRGARDWPVDAPAPPALSRRPLGDAMATGLAALDVALPLVRGQRIGLFAGAGVGKSTLLGTLLTRIDCDAVVVALVGERGREVREMVQEVLGPAGMARTVVVAATADRPAMVRRRCAGAAMAVAEALRDAERHVLFVCDSVTRFAEAHREVALAAGEAQGPGGYPPSTAARLSALAERAGPDTGAGDITAIFSVLLEGEAMEGPVADGLRGVLDGHVLLSRTIAERGRFPAIDLVRSVSRAPLGRRDARMAALATDLRACISAYEHAEMMIASGLYRPGHDAALDRAVTLWPALDAWIGARSENIEAAAEQLADLLGDHAG